MTTENEIKPAAPVEALDGGRCAVDALFGSVVRLVPTEGCYQKEKEAIFLCDTSTEYRVRITNEYRVRRFRKSTMLHVSPHDRQFPNYRLVLPNVQSEPRGKAAPKAEVSPSRVGL